MFTKKEYEVSRIYILQSSIRQVFVLVKKHNKARYHGERVVGGFIRWEVLGKYLLTL